MTTAIATVFLTFVLTGLLGNWLIQQWQHRNWINQQRFLGEQKVYENLKALCDETMIFASRRVWRMRRLLNVLAQANTDLINTRRSEYDQALSDWNERITDFQVRLTLYGPYDMLNRFNDEIQESFRTIGVDLETMLKKRLADQPATGVARLESRMNGLNGRLYEFNKDLNSMLELQRRKMFYGKEVTLDGANLESFKTWELVKAFFKPRVAPLTVVRSPSDLHPPL